tara:strand:- start:203 stop:1075 length:873 start_codon:yes stop_codon:yes gene_type:complete
MKLITKYSLIFFLPFIQLRAKEDPTPIWSHTKTIQSPESCYLDKESGFLFVSQIGAGGGAGKDGDGWISKLNTDGKIIKNKWATGLNAPKGLRSTGETLWVTDIDRIVAFNIKSGKQTHSVKIANAKFLNDLACGEDGTVYFSDMIASIIYQYKNNKVSILAEGMEIEHPNGLLVEGNKLIIGAWGLEIQNDFTTKKLGRLLSLDLQNKKITPLTKEPLGNLDGVESDGNGGYIVTDWIAGKVFHVNKSGKSKTWATFPKGAADHAYLSEKKILILPEMLENKISAFHFK